MKKTLTNTFVLVSISAALQAQTIITGPSSSQSSYLQPLVPGSTITSVMTATNTAGNYTMAGLPDGTGAFDNGDGTFTLLMNHEMGNTVGAVHAHGAQGAFVSKWKINKSTLSVISGADLMQNVNLWTGTTYTTYNSTNPSTLTAFARFCSADLPAVTAYYNPATGKGTQERIFMNGEENGNEGRALAHVVTGTEAGNTYELPYLGKASFENQVASPFPQDKTIVAGLDDSTPGQVYIYVGNKSTTGTEIVKAGLSGGKLYGVAVLGLLNETSTGVPQPGTVFNLIDMGSVQNSTGATLNTNSNNVGVTNFLRPEDGAWDPSNPRDFYFVTTNAFTAPSRMWRLRFNDITNPEQGGTITAVLDGTEGQKMLDNITIDHYGHIMAVEDVGNNAHNGKIWQYKIATDALTLFAQHDTTRFISGGANFLTQDEEASGIIDAQEVLGPGKFLFVDQAHYSIPNPIVEGGQLLALYNPNSANANPEINVQGNNNSIASGNNTVSLTDFTNFDKANIGNSVIRPFLIQNAGPGVLSITSLSIGGVNAGDFTVVQPSPFPATLAVSATQTVYIRFAPPVTGVRNAIIYLKNNDFDESNYSFAVSGTGVVQEIEVKGNAVVINDNTTVVSTSDNTDFGNIIYGNAVIKNFMISNTGTGTLTVNSISISGNNSYPFTIMNMPQMPLVLASNATATFDIQYMAPFPATHTAMVSIMSDDADESNYDFMISGKSLFDVGVEEQNTLLQTVLYPNPANMRATLIIPSADGGDYSVTITDLMGRVMKPRMENQWLNGESIVTINTADLSQGEYLVTVSNGKNSTSMKLLVAH